MTERSASAVTERYAGGSAADLFPTRILGRPEVRELPPAPENTAAIIGPGIVAAGVGLASGEFILYPYIASQVGLVFVWAALVGVMTQFFLNMEIERYTLATGETALTGFSRFWRHWGLVFAIMTYFANLWPGWATSSATMITYLVGGEPRWIAIGMLIVIGLILTLAPVVYVALERLQIVKVAAVDDYARQDPHNTLIVHAVAPGSAAEYVAQAAKQRLDVRVLDNETPGVLVTESDGRAVVSLGNTTTHTPGPGDSYTLRLTGQPTADVQIALVADGQTNVSPLGATTMEAIGGPTPLRLFDGDLDLAVDSEGARELALGNDMAEAEAAAVVPRLVVDHLRAEPLHEPRRNRNAVSFEDLVVVDRILRHHLVHMASRMDRGANLAAIDLLQCRDALAHHVHPLRIVHDLLGDQQLAVDETTELAKDLRHALA